MRISDLIEAFIKENLTKKSGPMRLNRNELANQFKVVPSQINYVLSSRFTQEQGYIIESHRGGGGYILITQININKEQYLMHIVNNIGDSLDAHSAMAIVKNLLEYDYIALDQARIINAAVSHNVLLDVPLTAKDNVRARLLKNMLVAINLN